eukprot:TRINITY_DN2849_c0_g1_i1.p1 TRINITY_DN2849_c0_g1~~TRINITY_DN2849_c0_g1_i1.p1  ORF type:complete len:227 (+),score=26.27 TRINITY_DN2849_c0_g1_i1:618-1298(+)
MLVVFLLWAESHTQDLPPLLSRYVAMLAEMDSPSVASWPDAAIAAKAVEVADPSLMAYVERARNATSQSFLNYFSRHGQHSLSTKYPALFEDTDLLGRARFAKYRYLVRSRFWRLKLGAGWMSFMAPGMDFFNHGEPGTTSLGIEATGPGLRSVVLRADKEFGVGEEVTFYYGGHCIADSLVEYGFSTPELQGCCGCSGARIWAALMSRLPQEFRSEHEGGEEPSN